jgi:hypothetical protein
VLFGSCLLFCSAHIAPDVFASQPSTYWAPTPPHPIPSHPIPPLPPPGHKAKNLVPDAGMRATQVGLKVRELQLQLPAARIVYCSATGASGECVCVCVCVCVWCVGGWVGVCVGGGGGARARVRFYISISPACPALCGQFKSLTAGDPCSTANHHLSHRPSTCYPSRALAALTSLIPCLPFCQSPATWATWCGWACGARATPPSATSAASWMQCRCVGGVGWCAWWMCEARRGIMLCGIENVLLRVVWAEVPFGG